MEKNMLIEYCITKDLIRKCHNINRSIPKGYGTRSTDYQFHYNQKDRLIKKIVEKIKKSQLPIKYGISVSSNGWVTFFSFEGQQFSFHGKYGIEKIYNGKWIGKIRKSDAIFKNKTPGKKDMY